METLYEVLGLEETATQAEIKAAYKTLAGIYHPDKETGDNDRFVEVKAAYEVLGNIKRRQAYDETGDTTNHVDNGPDFQAKGMLRSLFAQMFADQDYAVRDYVPLAKQSILQTIHMENVSMKNAKKKLAKVTKLAKHAKGDLVQGLLGQQIEQIETGMQASADNKALLQRALELVDEVSFTDLAEAMMLGMTGADNNKPGLAHNPFL